MNRSNLEMEPKYDEKWHLVKPRYLENKKWLKGTVKHTRIMNA